MPTTRIAAVLFIVMLVYAFVLTSAKGNDDIKTVDAAAVDRLVVQRLAASNVPAIAVAVLRDGKAPHVVGRGFADIEQAAQADAATVFPIASITKVFVGVAVMLLQQDGRLSTSDKLARFLPDYPGAEQITLAQLLTHTSGVPNFTGIPAFADNQAKDWSPDQLVALFSKEPSSFPPGARCLYSDAGFILLGLVIEKASGQTFGDFVRHRITRPLAMTTTTMGSNRAIVPHRGAGYVGKRDAWQNAPYFSLLTPFSAGGMISTVGDLVLIGQALSPTSGFLRPESVAAMVAPVVLNDGSVCRISLPGANASYGYGLELITFADLPRHRSIGKSGVIPGYSSYVARFEGTDLTIVVIANGDSSLGLVGPLTKDLAKLILKE
jgi:D-alanyl-D-alanine carboxypeptidase